MRAAFLMACAGLFGLGVLRADEKAAPVRVTMAELVETYLTNVARAEEYYQHKRVEVTGKMKRVRWGDRSSEQRGWYIQHDYVMDLDVDVGQARKGKASLELHFDHDQRKKLADLKVGQQVTVVGECSCYGFPQDESGNLSLKLTGCQLVHQK
jgi:hypothetical protein